MPATCPWTHPSELPPTNKSGRTGRSRRGETPGCCVEGDNRGGSSFGGSGEGWLDPRPGSEGTARGGEKDHDLRDKFPVGIVSKSIRCCANRANGAGASVRTGHNVVNVDRPRESVTPSPSMPASSSQVPLLQRPSCESISHAGRLSFPWTSLWL